jgi:serine/threonine protein kinase
MNLQLTQLGPYRIGKTIGKGGMGSVYEAVDSQTGQRVAIKALSPHLAQVEGFRERFEAEIESLKTLRHEGIVRLYGYGEQDGILFYSMEIIDGLSLEDELKAGRRFVWREVTDIAIQLCMALKHAHDHGIIHRDIKPANILFADDKHVKLADFGIARLFGNTSSLTAAGGVLGTADYMSPEQADGRPVTARCDQYSLGGVMYALLAGRPPFRAKNLPEMLQLQRFADPEPVSRYAADTPKQLEQLIAQLLAKNPAERFPNTQVLARHLQAMVRALSRPAPDGFALATDPVEKHLSDADLGHSIAMAATRDESATPPPIIRSKTPLPIAPGDVTARPLADVDATLAADEPASAPNAKSISLQAVPATAAASAAPMPSSAVFTTVEEELARTQQVRSWTAVFAPLASLLLFLAAVVGLAYYMTRPYSADSLYAQISERTASENPNALHDVKNEIAEFIRRFPDDPRSAELREHSQRIDLDEMHRRLQARARREGVVAAEMLPVEVLYLDAMEKSSTAPRDAIALLETLIALYGVNASGVDSGDANSGTMSREERAAAERRAGCVALAQRQLDSLREDVAQLETREIAAVRERLATAAKLSASQPATAREMYRAVITLYNGQPWAAEIVSEAHAALNKLDAADD